jgi:hypothetical protein
MPTDRTTVRRLGARGRYERSEIDAILDEAPFCHVGFLAEHGPVVIPTIHARDGSTLYLHGSPASAMLRSIEGADLCVTATILDGFVVARSAFHSSMNYRSVVVFGRGRAVTDEDEKARAMRAVTDHVVPGRWDELRGPTPKEIAATKIVAVELDEASAKVRTGPPVDDDDDLSSGTWGGVLPVGIAARAPEPDDHTPAGEPVPASVEALRARYR